MQRRQSTIPTRRMKEHRLRSLIAAGEGIPSSKPRPYYPRYYRRPCKITTRLPPYRRGDSENPFWDNRYHCDCRFSAVPRRCLGAATQSHFGQDDNKSLSLTVSNSRHGIPLFEEANHPGKSAHRQRHPTALLGRQCSLPIDRRRLRAALR